MLQGRPDSDRLSEHRAALILNLLAVWPVLFYALGRAYRAFVRGRHSRNLDDGSSCDAVLAVTVGALRTQLGLDAPRPVATAGHRAPSRDRPVRWNVRRLG